MTLSLKHVFDNGKDNLSVYIQASARSDGASLYEIKYSDDPESEIEYISSVSLKMNGKISVVSSQDFYNVFSERDITAYKNSAGLLKEFKKSPFPICVRYKSPECVVIERPPFLLSPRIRYSRRSFRKDSKYAQEHDIWIPWTVFILSVQEYAGLIRASACLFFKDSPIMSFDDPITIAYTPNIYSDGRICLGETEQDLFNLFDSKQFSFSDINEIYSFVINQYFAGGWNMDLQNSVLHSQDYFKEYLSRKDILSIEALANRADNQYILSLIEDYKEYSLSDKYGREDFVYFSARKNYYKFIMNYLSCLTLEETLQLTRVISEKNRPYSYFKNKKNAPITIGDVLAARDSGFYRIHQEKYSQRGVLCEFDNRVRRDISTLGWSCSSSSINRTPLHTVKFLISFNVDDFLNYCSEQILNFYHDRYSWIFGDFSRDCFYKKNIKFHLHKIPENFYNRLVSCYFEEIQKQKNYPKLFDALHEKLKELSVLYTTKDAISQDTTKTQRNTVAVDLTELELVLDKSLVSQGVGV